MFENKKKKNDVTSDVSPFAADGKDETKAVTNKSFLDLSGLSRLTTLMTSFVSNYAAPKVHNHDSSYAKASHTHTISNVTGLQDQLNAKADKGSFAAASHTHTIANITNLQSQLDSKQAKGSYAASSHSHAWSAITSKPSTFTPASHTHTSSQVTDLKSYLLNNVFKVGYVWISYTSTSPASIIGGTWTAITGRFPYFNAGTSTGGSNSHTLSVNQIPSHSHKVGFDRDGNGINGSTSGFGTVHQKGISGAQKTVNTSNTGSSSSHNNMPSYQTLYAWRRTS